MTTINYAQGTYLRTSTMWDLYSGGAVMCSDGVVRTLKRIAITPDTFFSIPAAVSVRGRTVSGYVSVDTANDPGCTVVFTATGKNAPLLHKCSVSEIYSIPDRVMGAGLVRGAQVSKCACGKTLSYEPRNGE